MTDGEEPPEGGQYECHECGNETGLDSDGFAICWNPSHGKRILARPCGICEEKTITTAEICRDCAEKTDGNAMTPMWGKGKRLFDEGDDGE